MVSQPGFTLKCTRAARIKLPKPRGFAFTADAALAVILFISVITALSYAGVFEPTQPFTNLEIKRNIEASLEILDMNSTLQSLDSTAINTSLKMMLPKRIGWRLSIKKFVPSGSSFTQVASVNAGDWSVDLNEVNFIQGRRLFLDFNATDTTGFFNAEWRAWRK